MVRSCWLSVGQEGNTLRRAIRLAGLAMLCALGVAAFDVGWRVANKNPVHPTTATDVKRSVPRAAPQSETVMAIGGSVAYGWVDPHGGGYLKRAFATLSQKAKRNYVFDNKAIIGANSTQLNITLYKGRYTGWLNTVKPQVVVISWGLLNDCYPKTPFATFDATIHHEIAAALRQKAVVLMVTPPVTKASYTQYLTLEPKYVNSEVYVADSFNSPNVVVFDVFNQMKAYLAEHHLSYVPYEFGGWHPNAKGHELAGSLLEQDIWLHYGDGPIHFVEPSQTAQKSQGAGAVPPGSPAAGSSGAAKGGAQS